MNVVSTFLVTLVLAFSFSTGLALTEKEMLELVKKPHNREGISEAMKIFPDARKIKVLVNIDFPAEAKRKEDPVIASEKVVDGRYLVTQYTLGKEEHKINFISITEYSELEAYYIRWVYNDKTKDVIKSVGVRLKDTNVIGWSMLPTKDEKDQIRFSIGTENYEAKIMKWSERQFVNGKPVFGLSGTTEVVK